MICPDINVLVGAFRADTSNHHELKAWLESAMAGTETLGLTTSVLSGVVRVLTNPRVFREPSTPQRVFDQIDSALSARHAQIISPGPRHWALFTRLVAEAQATGGLVSDAHHAAIALEHGATWVSLDRDFAKFPSLTWVRPFPAH